jgi:hypothetical protein
LDQFLNAGQSNEFKKTNSIHQHFFAYSKSDDFIERNISWFGGICAELA